MLTLNKITLSIKIHNTATRSIIMHRILAQRSDVCHNFFPIILGVDMLFLTGTVSSVVMLNCGDSEHLYTDYCYAECHCANCYGGPCFSFSLSF